MHDIRKILLATRQNQPSRHAELRAALLSAQLDIGAFDMISLGQGGGAGALRSVQPRPAACVVAARAEEMGADLTVLAPQRRNAFLELIAPSDSEEIIRRSRNAVLVVQRAPAAHYRRVLVAVDFSQSAFDAARVALALAPGAHLSFLHAYSLPDEGLMREFEVPASVIEAYRMRGVDSARERLSAWIDALKPMRQPRARAVHSGLPLPAIRSCARRIGADLIVVGRRGDGGSGRDALGTVPRRLAREAGCDLLIGPAALARVARRAAYAVSGAAVPDKGNP